MARILGLDPASTKYGWSVLDTETNEIIDKGVMNFRDYKKDEQFGDLLKILHDELQRIVKRHKIEYAVAEDTYCKNVKTVSKLSEIRAATRLGVYPLQLHLVHTLSMKSHIGMNKDKKLKEQIKEIKSHEEFTKSQIDTRVTKAKKECVMRIVNEKYNLNVKVNDISDSIAIADTFAATL